jgi:exonuclease III
MDPRNILVWNMCELNSRARRNVVRELVAAKRPSIVFFQETKLSVITPFDVLQFLGTDFEYSYLPADQIHGGILLAWCSAVWSVSTTSTRVFLPSTKLRSATSGSKWWLMMMYGHCSDGSKADFLVELNDLHPVRAGSWMICGDFNMVYRAEDKNNCHVNRRLMGKFRRFINEATLQEIHLNGRLFTWSNERAHPKLECIDSVFISNEWEELFLANELHLLVSLCSDHAPLLLQCDAPLMDKGCFHFRAFWPKCVGFMEVIQQAWHCPMQGANPFRKLDWLLRNTTRFLKS